MKRIIPVAVLLLAAIAVPPRGAAAQCNQKCLVLTNEAGEIEGYGCGIQQASGKSCIATAYRCTQQTCSNALLTDSEGAPAGILRRCDEPPTRAADRPARPHDPRRVRSAAAHPSVVVAKAEGEAEEVRARA